MKRRGWIPGRKLKRHRREGLIRERKFQVLTGGEIAVDHAAIIVQAMCILADRLLEKR